MQEKILFYLGVNHGRAFFNMTTQFSKSYGFEPMPNVYSDLISRNKNPNVKIVNACVTDKDGDADFYINNNDVTSSIFALRDDYNTSHMIQKINVKTINLLNFIKNENIDHIDMYLSDTQGMDFTILKTLESLLKEKRIYRLQCETYNDIIPGAYKNPNANTVTDYKNFLIPLGYEIENPQVLSNACDEYDLVWRIK